MVESQYCFEIKEVGKNLDKEHQVFNLMYLIEIFKEFYPEEFEVKKAKKGRRKKYNIKELLTFIFWAKYNNRESYRDLENWYENNDETCQLVLKCEKPKKSLLNQFKNEYSGDMLLTKLYTQFIKPLSSKQQSASLAIIVYFFTICELFEK